MKSIVRTGSILCLSGISLIFSGCSGGNWLVGNWELDKDKTMAAFAIQSGAPEVSEDEPKNELGKLVGGILKSVGKGITGALLDQFANSKVEFTRSEIRITKHGEGKAVPYKIIERPDSGTLVIQLEDGTITSWHRDGEFIKQALNGDDAVWLYFRRTVQK